MSKYSQVYHIIFNHDELTLEFTTIRIKGRAGAKGVAHTFFTQGDRKCATQLVEVLAKAEQEVPPELQAMARPRFGGRGGRGGRGRGRGYSGGRGGRGGYMGGGGGGYGRGGGGNRFGGGGGNRFGGRGGYRR